VPKPTEQSLRKIDPHGRLGPVRDAVFVTILIFASFAGTATWIAYQGRQRELSHHREAVESAAWRAAATVDPNLVRNASVHPPTPDEHADAMGKLADVRLAESAVSRVSVIHPADGKQLVIFDTDATRGQGANAWLITPIELVPQEANIARNVYKTGKSQSITRQDGTVKAYVPIVGNGGEIIGVATAESAAHTLRVGLAPIEFAARSSLILGAILSLVVGVAVYSWRNKSLRSAANLLHAERTLQDIVDAAGEYIWAVDASGRYVYLSDRVRAVLGLSPQQLLGRHPMELVPEEDRAAVSAQSEALIDGKSSFRDFEHRITRADGKIIWLSVNGLPVFDAEGNFAGYRGAGLDITMRKEIEQALIEEKEAAQAAVKAKSEFLATMSHEIRTPLNSVIGFTDLLTKTQLDGMQREYLEMISRSGDSLLELLNDILDFSRAESGKFEVKIVPVNIRKALAELLDLFHPLAEAKGLVLQCEILDEVPEIIGVDYARLRQILLNFIGNAVKFTEQGAITIFASGGTFPVRTGFFPLHVEVRDTGGGIPADKVGLLFQPFSQVDSSATRRFGGTGLGLAICKRLVELLHGHVGLASSSPSGSVFYVDLEVEGLPSTSEPLLEKNAPAPVLRPSRILVVEDNRINCRLVQQMLVSLGLSSDSAEEGSQCLKMHQAQPYDVILMDVQMPVLDGLDTTRRIREMERNGSGLKRAHIIALTANALAGDRDRCLAAGMDDYLSKPIRSVALAEVLARAGMQKNGQS